MTPCTRGGRATGQVAAPDLAPSLLDAPEVPLSEDEDDVDVEVDEPDDDSPLVVPPGLSDFADFNPYASEYQPPPFKMKLPPAIIRRALGLPHEGHFFVGASVMRCSFSKSLPQPSQ
jgi:hypothetical protein